MKPRSNTLGMLRETDHPTLVFSSTNVFGGVLEEGDDVLFYPHWYRATSEGSLQLVTKTAIPVQKVPRTTRGEWQLDLETLLDMPLDQRLRPRQSQKLPRSGFSLFLIPHLVHQLALMMILKTWASLSTHCSSPPELDFIQITP
jgi:hypothetical protein